MAYIFKTQNDFRLFPLYKLRVGLFISDKPKYTFTEDTIRKDHFSIFFDVLSECINMPPYRPQEDFLPTQNRSFERLIKNSSSLLVNSHGKSIAFWELTFSEEYKGLIKKDWGAAKSFSKDESDKMKMGEYIIEILNKNFDLLDRA